MTRTPEETFELGKELALYILKANTKTMPKIGFRGGLGAGKTVFIKGFVMVLYLMQKLRLQLIPS